MDKYDLPPYFSPKKAAELSGFSRKFIYAAILSGELKATKKHHLWRIKREDFIEFMAASSARAVPIDPMEMCDRGWQERVLKAVV